MAPNPINPEPDSDSNHGEFGEAHYKKKTP